MMTDKDKYISGIKTALLFCVALLLPLSVQARKKMPVAVSAELTAEEQHRFYYYFYAAEKAYNEERYEDAFHIFGFCYEIDNTDPIVNQYLGDFMSAMKQFESALLHYLRSYNSDRQNEAIYYRLEQTYIRLGDFQKALLILDDEERLYGKDGYSAYKRYHIYAMQGDAKNALKTVEKYLKKDVYNIQFLLYRAELYSLLNKPYKKQKLAYESILELDRSNTMILNNYAYLIATHKGDLKLAEELSRETIKREPDNCTYLDTYAWILHLRGEKELARFYMQRTMKCIAEFQPESFGNKEIQEHYKAIMENNK